MLPPCSPSGSRGLSCFVVPPGETVFGEGSGATPRGAFNAVPMIRVVEVILGITIWMHRPPRRTLTVYPGRGSTKNLDRGSHIDEFVQFLCVPGKHVDAPVGFATSGTEYWIYSDDTFPSLGYISGHGKAIEPTDDMYKYRFITK